MGAYQLTLSGAYVISARSLLFQIKQLSETCMSHPGPEPVCTVFWEPIN